MCGKALASATRSPFTPKTRKLESSSIFPMARVDGGRVVNGTSVCSDMLLAKIYAKRLSIKQRGLYDR